MHKMIKTRKEQKVILIEKEEYIKEAQYLAKISDLESKIKEFKALQIKDAR